MKEHRRRVTIDVRDPVQLALYEQFRLARQAWGDQGQQLDKPIIQALQAQARLQDEVARQRRDDRARENVAIEERGRQRRNDILAQRYREQDARNRAAIPPPNPRDFDRPDSFTRAVEEWRRVVQDVAPPQYPPGIYPVENMDAAAEIANRRINMRDAVDIERRRQNEIARQRYNEMVARQHLVEQGDAAMRDLFAAPGGPPTPEERALQRARDWADQHNAGILRRPMQGVAQEAQDFFYRPEPPKEPAHMQEFDEVE